MRSIGSRFIPVDTGNPDQSAVRDLARQAVPELFDFPLDTAVNHIITNYNPVSDRLRVDAALCKQALDR